MEFHAIGGGDEYNSPMISVLFVASFLLSILLTRMFMSPSSWVRVMDHPNERSLHTVPVSRAGGLAIMAAFFAVIGVAALLQDIFVSPVLIFCALLIAVISFIDDCYSLSAAIRFVVHFCAAIIVVMNGYTLTVLEFPGWSWQWPESLALAASSIFIVWSINLYNFMDGMDGFSAGMAVIGFSFFALLGWQAQEPLFVSANLIVVGAVLGFLVFNFPPAKIFMGDIGASTLGFLMAAFSLWASVDKIFPIWVAVFVFSPFIVDATVTLIRRVLARERVWKAHRSHYYQRLVQLGWGHRKTVLYAYLLMILCGSSSWLAMQLDVVYQVFIVFAWMAIYILIILGIKKLQHRYGFE